MKAYNVMVEERESYGESSLLFHAGCFLNKPRALEKMAKIREDFKKYLFNGDDGSPREVLDVETDDVYYNITFMDGDAHRVWVDELDIIE